MINKIFGKIFNSTKYPHELKNLKLIGELYRKRINKPKELIAEECSLFVSIVNEKTFDYNLNVHNEDYQYNKDSWELIRFTLNNDRGIKYCTEKGREAIVWEYNKEFYIFYLLIDSETEKVKEDFLAVLCDMITSNEYQEDLLKASQNEGRTDYISNYNHLESLDSFLDENYSSIYGAGNISKGDDDINKITQGLDNVKIEQLNFKSSFPNYECLFVAKGQLFQYDSDKDDLIVKTLKGVFQIMKVEAYKYYIVVEDEADKDKTLLSTAISQETNIVTNKQDKLIMWLSKDFTGISAYNFVFYDTDSLEDLRRVIAKSKYESSSLSKYEELKEEEKEWIENENIPDEEIDDDNNDVEMEFDNNYQESASDKPNKLTAQAYIHDRTFVIRDDNTIGVYKTDEDEVLSHLVNLPAVVEYKDKNIDVRNANMFYSDSNMVLLDKLNPNSLFRYDLGTGKIVEEWSAEKMKTIESIAPENKMDQMTDSQILLGVNDRNLFVMDGRVNKKDKVVSVKNYKTNPKMNCLVTTDFGGVATGSINGEIRLYREVGKNAKTLLPCFGDPIRSIDVTTDGKYILATCDRYLILIPTMLKGDNNGFEIQMGKNKPHPKTLKIKPIDLHKYGLSKLNFMPAKFNVNKIEGETNIITSIGDYVVIWNFAKVKKGILDDYKIKKVNQFIVDNQFKYNKNQVVVTMENKLRIQNQKKLFDEK